MTLEITPTMSRRALLQGGALVLSSGASVFHSLAGMAGEGLGPDEADPIVRLGLVTDIHYADKPAAGKRFYRESLGKLDRCLEHFAKSKVEFAVELGDFIDLAGTVEEEIHHLKTIDEKFAEFTGPRHYVLGNHCVDGLNKKQFFANSAAREPHYSFDHGPCHFIVLDACYRSDGQDYGHRNFDWTDANIPAHEIEWLREDLDRTDKRTFVFVHQRLDIEGAHAVNNAAEVRKVLEEGNKVVAVFQGHNHLNAHQQIGGIHYCTLTALVEESGPEANAFATAEIFPDHSLKIHGFYRQDHHQLGAMGG